VLNMQLAILMKYYSKGSLAAAIEQHNLTGLEVKQCLRCAEGWALIE
jgi:hypothetical protein